MSGVAIIFIHCYTCISILEFRQSLLPCIPIVATDQDVKEQEGLAPSVVSKPKAQVVVEGEIFHLECSLVASPAPEVQYIVYHFIEALW